MVLFTTASISAQFGISYKQNANDVPLWDERATNAVRSQVELFSLGWEVGVDYWFRLENKRIEFLPQLGFSRASTPVTNDFVDSYEFEQIHLNFNTNIYFLDLVGDCDCPTFSKEGGTLSKGLFLQISPGLAYNQKKISYLPEDEDSSFRNNFSYKIGLALGVDIGLNDLITITPSMGYNYYPSIDWESFDLLHYDAVIASPTENKTRLGQMQFGIRLGFRPDYGNGPRF